MSGALRLGVSPPFSLVPFALLVSLRRPAFAVSLHIVPTTLDPVPIGGIVFDTSGSMLYGSDSTVAGTQLFGRNAWPGTWLGRPVAALAEPGALPIRRRRRLMSWSDVSPDTVVSGRLFGQDGWPGTWLETVVSGRLLARDAWSGTWHWRPVAALVVGHP